MPSSSTNIMKIGNKLSVEDIEVRDKRVLVRVDYNVPLTDDGTVANSQRIVATIPTLRLLFSRGARAIVLMSHLGRPDGQVIPSMSLKPVVSELETSLGKPVTFVDDCVGEKARKICGEAQDGQIILLENLRFHVEEEGRIKTKDGKETKATESDIASFRHQLSSLGDVYVNDAFGAVHRAHSSIVGINLRPRVCGLLIKKELEYFSKVLDSPTKIDLAILGGAKISDKIQLIKNLLPKVKRLAIGGGMCFTFLRVLEGMAIGQSLYDEGGAGIVREIMAKANDLGVEIILPTDFITGSNLTETATIGKATVASGIPSDMMGLDIGPNSIVHLVETIKVAKSVLWNGPVGVFTVSFFANGTKAVIEALIKTTENGGITIVGGGDSGAAVAKWNAEDKLSHVSTGGGASLELLEGHVLPGIVALTDRS